MDGPYQGEVALLIDFENLVRGVEEGPDALNCEVLFRFAEEHGRVLTARAYGDWRMRELNQYQVALDRLGADLVHVLGRWREGEPLKNAVDVKMAVDAVSILAYRPNIDIFVIVSGDRDFIPLLKELRLHGKIVVGVSPRKSASNDLASLCDRFVYYESLLSSFGSAVGGRVASLEEEADGDAARPPSLEEVRRALAAVLRRRPEGVKGAQVKPLLRRWLSPSFDESLYGYTRLTEMLRDMEDVVRVEPAWDGSDIVVFPAGEGARPSPKARPLPEERPRAESCEPLQPEGNGIEDWIRRAELDRYSYERDPDRRRMLLRRLYDALDGREEFTWREIREELAGAAPEARLDPDVTMGILELIYHVKGFFLLSAPEGVSRETRPMRLKESIADWEGFLRRYESSVAEKVRAAFRFQGDPPPALLARILGLPSDDPSVLDYCRSLLYWDSRRN